MGFSREMDYRLDPFRHKKFRDQSRIANIAALKPVCGVFGHHVEVFQIARIGEYIQVDDTASGICRFKVIYEVCTYKTRAAGNQNRGWIECLGHIRSF